MVGVGPVLAGTYAGNRRAAGWAGSRMHHDSLDVRVCHWQAVRGCDLALSLYLYLFKRDSWVGKGEIKN
jgi:hypothetical protein